MKARLPARAAIWALAGTWGILAAAPPARSAESIERSVRSYTLPAVQLQRADGKTLKLAEALSDGRPVVLTFMYSSCQTVCPITNQVMVGLGELLAERRDQVHLISISIDPDHDTVKQLAQYARQSGHRGSFFTGDPASSEAVQRAFDAWRGDKMHHEPAFFLNRNADSNRAWVRLTGLVTPKVLLAELTQLAPALRTPLPAAQPARLANRTVKP
jgi:protein SCO1